MRLIYDGLENCAWCGCYLGQRAINQIGSSTTQRIVCQPCWDSRNIERK